MADLLAIANRSKRPTPTPPPEPVLTIDELVDRELEALGDGTERREAAPAVVQMDPATPGGERTVTITGVIGTDGSLVIGPPTPETAGLIIDQAIAAATSTGEVGPDGLIARCEQIRGAIKESLICKVEVRVLGFRDDVVVFAIEVWNVAELAGSVFRRTRELTITPGQVL